MLRLIQAEFIKLKYLPIFWLCGVVVLTVFAIVFSAHFVDVNRVATLGGNPWQRINIASVGVFSVFMSIPFSVLLFSAALYLEHQFSIFKFQYTAPLHRAFTVINKLLTLLLIISFVFLLLIGSIFICGHLLDFFLPEMEFKYYTFQCLPFAQKLAHTFLSLLGLLSIQLFLGFRFKGFLIPAGFGVFAFIVGLILGSTDNAMALYFPYSYPFVVQDYNMFRIENIEVISYGWINSIEIRSFIFFLFFVSLTVFMESRRNVN